MLKPVLLGSTNGSGKRSTEQQVRKKPGEVGQPVPRQRGAGWSCRRKDTAGDTALPGITVHELEMLGARRRARLATGNIVTTT